MYGICWQHANLNALTHETVHEFFGYVSTKCMDQIRMSIKAKKVVSYSGEDIYLPDVDKKERLKSPDYLEKIGRLDFPITFIVGEPRLPCTPLTVAPEANLDPAYNFVVMPFFFSHERQ